MVAISDREAIGSAASGQTARYEYRVERTPFGEEPTKHLPELLERLNELGSEGWRVVSVDLTVHPAPMCGPNKTLPVLMVREIPG
jgi:hypothetical protein